ncbi:MAG: ABC transporter permease [Candidatus Binatia bacterium]|nr:MAG: ABC transporter permease [Candidatus Binatia bacterium]
MDFLLEALARAWSMLRAGDPEVFSAVKTTLQVTLASVTIAAALALPTGYALALAEFPGRKAVVTALHTLVSVPTVAIGLVVYAMLSRRGPLGELGWLYSKKAIVLGQVLLALPLLTALSLATTEAIDRRLWQTVASLGGGRLHAFREALHEARHAYAAAAVAAFGRVVSEVGISIMVGGNIRGRTRTVTTAIALETTKGEFETGLALGLILVLLAFSVTGLATVLRERKPVRA